ncbi:unnamed protein product [Rhizoctonia solani]|uniref:Uncharacterized protein n=1 Tax=Rhizoctonia solani TaxID=456999 RepID=A0A8H3GTL1_9AGAM|nr:unnamed protein product [Rhizoctonia solani]
MIHHRWAYFLNTQELVNLFKECGGGIGNFDPEDVVFFVGKPVPNIRESVDRGLARRCKDIFERSPDPCRVVRESLSLQWDLTARDGSVHRLHLMEFLQSDLEGDRYPLTEEELALFPSQRAASSSSSGTS